MKTYSTYKGEEKRKREKKETGYIAILLYIMAQEIL